MPLLPRIYSSTTLYYEKLCYRSGNSTGGRRPGQVMVLLLLPFFPLSFLSRGSTWFPRHLSLQAAPASQGGPQMHIWACGWCRPSTQMMTPCESQEPGFLRLQAGAPAQMGGPIISYLLTPLTSIEELSSLFHAVGLC